MIECNDQRDDHSTRLLLLIPPSRLPLPHYPSFPAGGARDPRGFHRGGLRDPPAAVRDGRGAPWAHRVGEDVPARHERVALDAHLRDGSHGDSGAEEGTGAVDQEVRP